MRLGDFIESRLEPILAEWEAFAATLQPAAAHLDTVDLRDHAQAMLEVVVRDLAQSQTGEAQALKSRGLAPKVGGAPPTAAQSHATLRARDGFNINQMVAEYRALRATVLRLWLAETTPSSDDLQDIIRFNEAIDQAVAESVEDFTLAIERSRNLLLGMLGHDMRNPLGVIVSTASYLRQLNAGEAVSVAATRLINSGLRIQELLGDLVDFSRTQLGVGINVTRQNVDLGKVFRDELELLRAAHPGRQIDLEVRGDVVGPWDGHRIHQVLGNLATNALKYGSGDTPVRMKLEGDADGVNFSVANDGAAIPAEVASGMFEPLVRGVQGAGPGDRADEGLGLGLYIARAIVQAHEGAITFRSDNSGTVFSVELPRGPDAITA